MLIEMMMLCYVARNVYYVDLEKNQKTDAADRTPRTSGQVDTTNNNDGNKQHSATVVIT